MTAAGRVDEITFLGPSDAIVCVRGWAAIFASNQTPDGVYISIDGGPPIDTLYGEEREDVARAAGDESLVECGFRALFSTAHLAPGHHGVTLSIRDRAGRRIVVDDTAGFEIEDDDRLRALAETADESVAVVQIDSLTVDGKADTQPLHLSQTSVLEIGGWAIDAAAQSAASAVFAVIESTVARATYGFPRPDVAAARGGDAYRDCGFSLHVAMDTIPPGRHRLEIRVLGADGKGVFRGTSLPVDVSSPVVAAIARGTRVTRGSIDDAMVFDVEGTFKSSGVPLTLRRGERLLLRGWTVDEHGDALAGAVHVSVDDARATPAVYRIDRVDVARALGRPDLSSCGFLGVVSTTALHSGAHVASIRVTGSDGRSAYELDRFVEFLVTD